jgi:hypothetical protein
MNFQAWERTRDRYFEDRIDRQDQEEEYREEVMSSLTMMEHFTALAEESVIWDALEGIIGEDTRYIELLTDAIEVAARSYDEKMRQKQ